ncbi:MAG: hypothetical protein IPL79_03845 [Myxococcales bacterium]|nr:hypothetical protein [Myxococcales bacterium]
MQRAVIRSTVRRVCAGAIALTLASCARDENVSDARAIEVNAAGGMIVARVATSDEAAKPALIDVLSPLTVRQAALGEPIERRAETLYLYAQGPDGAPRAALGGFFRFAFCGAATCLAGPADATTPIEAVIGADALAGNALRINFVAQVLYLFPDIVGTTLERSRECDAVFTAPYYGGGTIYVRGTPVVLGARRPVLDGCVNGSISTTSSGAGVNTMFTISTGIATSLLGEATYERLRLADPSLPMLADLPASQTYYAGTRISGRAAVLPRLELTSKPSTTTGDAGGACESLVRRARVLAGDACDNSDLCINLPAHVGIAPAAGIDFLVVPDALPLLQGLRAELREDELAELDGVLGGNALLASELDFDIPNNRILWRCRAEGCRAEPLFALAQKTDLAACFAPPTVP